jgi:hypothetical protein
MFKYTAAARDKGVNLLSIQDQVKKAEITYILKYYDRL